MKKPVKTKSLASRKGKPSGNASIGVRLMRYWPLYVMLLPCIVYYALICYVPMAGSVLAFKDYSFKKGIWGSRGLVLIISKRSSRATMQDD